MANFNALFAGCESFMEGDVEINNDVTVPAGDTAEAVESEVEAEDTAVEGAELTGESDAEVENGEAANMVFDQVLAMYDHVKNYGVDRTFLSLYNSNGQLNDMVGYSFPSCESIDSIGSPRSQASRAFIAAMEEDGIFRKIWEWIKKVCRAIANFFIKIADWFRDIMGNAEIRIGKLNKMVSKSTPKKNLDDKLEIKTTEGDTGKDLDKLWGLFKDIVSGQIDEGGIDVAVGAIKLDDDVAVNHYSNYASISKSSRLSLGEAENASVSLLDEAVRKAQGAARMTGFKKEDQDKYSKKINEKKHFDEVDQAKHFARKVQTKILDKISKKIAKVGSKYEEFSKVTAIGGITKYAKDNSNAKDLLDASVKHLTEHLRNIVGLRQFIERMKLNQKHMNDNAELGYRLTNGESMSREASEDGRKATQCFNIIVNVRSKGLTLCYKLLTKQIAIVANHVDKLLDTEGTKGTGVMTNRTPEGDQYASRS